MDHISKALQALIATDEIGRLIAGYRSVELWRDVVGARIAARTTPVRFWRGVLTVEVVDSTWLHEISFLRRTIVEKLNAEIGQPVVESVHLVLAATDPRPQRGH